MIPEPSAANAAIRARSVSSPAPNGPSPARRRRVFFWLAALGLTIRAVYFTEHAASAFFGVPILDEKYYDAVARGLAEGRPIADVNPGFRPLLYPFFLAAFYKLGGGTALALAAQHLLGVATALVVAELAMRLFRRADAGAWAGALYLLAGPPLFFEGELLIAALFTFLAAVQLLLVSRLGDRPLRWGGAGLWTGLAAQARPNVLVVLAAYPLLARRPKWTRCVAAALAGAVAALFVFGLLQGRYSGRFQWLGGSGGVNLYLGNERGADGMVPRQDRHVTYGDEYRDSVQVFAAEVYHEETGAGAPSEGISRFWLRRTFDEVRADPGAWLALMARKVWFMVWDREIPNNKSYAFVRQHESATLRVLPVRWWLLLALAPLGARLAWRRGDRELLRWIVVFAVLFAAGVVAFFVNARYRLPLWPALAVLAGGGAAALGDAARARRWRRLGQGVAAAAAVALASLVNWLGIAPESHARDFFFRSIAHLEKGRLEAAVADARRSVDLDASDAAAHFQLGTASLAAGAPMEALREFREAAALLPDEPRIWNNVGVAFDRLGRAKRAYYSYSTALFLAADYPPSLVNAALLELRAGLVDDAAAKVTRAGELGETSAAYFCALAFVERARGRADAARAALAEARRRDAETARRLEEEQERPLRPQALDREPP